MIKTYQELWQDFNHLECSLIKYYEYGSERCSFLREGLEHLDHSECCIAKVEKIRFYVSSWKRLKVIALKLKYRLYNWEVLLNMPLVWSLTDDEVIYKLMVELREDIDTIPINYIENFDKKSIEFLDLVLKKMKP